MGQRGFIGKELLPFTPVASQAGNYGIITPDQMLIAHEDVRAPGSSYNRGQSTFKALTYACLEHGVEEAVDDREAKMYANYFDAESFAARRARDTVLRNLERRIIAKFLDYSASSSAHNFITAAAVGTYANACALGGLSAIGGAGTSWKTIATADPVTDISAASIAMYAASGFMPDTMVVSFKDYWFLRRNTSIQSQIKYSGLADPTLSFGAARQLFAELFGVSKFLVAGAQYASNKQGQALSLASIWTDGYVLIAKTAQSQDFKEPCIGRSFHWTADGSSDNGTVETYRDESRRSNIVRVRLDSDEQVILPTAGYLLTGMDA
jgi:hypothetical protein